MPPMSTANPSFFTAPVVVVTSFILLLLPLLTSSATRASSSIPKIDIDAMGILAVVPGFQRPQLDVSRETFAKVVNLVFETDLWPPFDVYGTTRNFLLGSYLMPYVGHTGYVGASSNLKSPEVKKLVRSLESVEAGQDAIIRYMLYECQINKCLGCSVVRPYNIEVGEFTRKLSALRDSLSGNGYKDEGIIVQPWQGAQKNITGNVIAGNVYSEGYDRTLTESFRIVYGTASKFLPGGFFPNGCNGNIARDFIAHAP